MAIIRFQSRKIAKASEIEGEILLIEDQRSLALMAAQMLHERWGCHVLIATNLEQVRTIIAQNTHHFFLAVSDLNLPDAPNGEVIDVLIAARISVIAMTGVFDESMQENILSKGVIDYVLKSSVDAYEYIVELVGRLHRNLRTKVLVVDDSRTFCSLISRMLRVQGLQVVTAGDGVEGLKLIEQQRDIKLVLVDLEMPNMDGFAFLSHVRSKLGKDRLAVIGMSGAGKARLSAQFLKLGANDFISKPATYEELVCRVSQNLEMQECIEAVRHIAYHDYLTGLLNRRAFFEQGGKLFQDAMQKRLLLAAVVMDIDFFKRINDTYGHDGGDVVLKHFSTLLGRHFEHQLVGRVGGEEFFMLFDDTDKVVEQCESFRLLVEQSQLHLGDALVKFTVSIGVTCQLTTSLDEMLKQADKSLYIAKESGRNRIIVT